MNAQERHDRIFDVIRSAQMQPVPVFSQGRVIIGLVGNSGGALSAHEVESRLSAVYPLLDEEDRRVARAIYMNLALEDSYGRPGARVAVLSDYIAPAAESISLELTEPMP